MGHGRSARVAAGSAFYETVHEVLKCVSGDGLLVIPDRTGSTFALTFPHTFPRTPAELPVTGGNSLFFSAIHSYAFVQVEPRRWKVRTDSYFYTVYDAGGQEALAYHYHPRGLGEDPIMVPHLHVYQDVTICGRYLPKVHLRTGRVALEDVIELLIMDFDVEPRQAEWEATLNAARAVFASTRSWSSWEHVEAPSTLQE